MFTFGPEPRTWQEKARIVGFAALITPFVAITLIGAYALVLTMGIAVGGHI